MEEKDIELEKIKIILGNSWIQLIKEVGEKIKNIKESIENVRCEVFKYERSSYLSPSSYSSLYSSHYSLVDDEHFKKLKKIEEDLKEHLKLCENLLEALKPESWDLICASDVANKIIKFYELG